MSFHGCPLRTGPPKCLHKKIIKSNCVALSGNGNAMGKFYGIDIIKYEEEQMINGKSN